LPYPYWSLDTNERGWRCSRCGVVLGYRPDLDRQHISTKIGDVLMLLHEGNFVYVSNSSHGEVVTASVARKCGIAGHYDQATIIRLLLAERDLAGEPHGEFYAREAAQWLDGEPTSSERAAERSARLNAGQLELAV
jgi:hypothetical protein